LKVWIKQERKHRQKCWSKRCETQKLKLQFSAFPIIQLLLAKKSKDIFMEKENFLQKSFIIFMQQTGTKNLMR